MPGWEVRKNVRTHQLNFPTEPHGRLSPEITKMKQYVTVKSGLRGPIIFTECIIIPRPPWRRSDSRLV